MNRRPRLLVLLAFLYCLSPLIYPFFVALYFETPFVQVAKETLGINSTLRNIEIFLLPIILGLSAFFARRVSYFIVILGSVYLLARNFLVFAQTSDSVPVSSLVFMNLLFVLVIAYLSRKNTRAIYFNPKLRWWETDPRYVVNWKGTLSRIGALSTEVIIRNIAAGGVAVETRDKGFLPHETVHIDFQIDGVSHKFVGAVVWEQALNESMVLIGIQWMDDKSNRDKKKVQEIIHTLKIKHTSTTRSTGWWEDVKAWATRPDKSDPH